jgi:hypothetical protein
MVRRHFRQLNHWPVKKRPCKKKLARGSFFDKLATGYSRRPPKSKFLSPERPRDEVTVSVPITVGAGDLKCFHSTGD